MENKSARAKVRAFGGFLTAMVIPNIGAFIALGFYYCVIYSHRLAA